MRSRILHAITIATFMSLHIAAAQDMSQPDEKISSKKVIGRLVNPQQGDYFHVSVKSVKGNEIPFFVDDEICFLSSNRKEVLVIAYDEIKRYFPEGVGYYPANIIQSISTGVEQKSWKRSENAAPNPKQWRECANGLLTLASNRRVQ